jgi:hypothetical protein
MARRDAHPRYQLQAAKQALLQQLQGGQLRATEQRGLAVLAAQSLQELQDGLPEDVPGQAPHPAR